MLSRRMIEEKLLKIGVPAGMSGFRYITDAEMLLDEQEGANTKFIALYEQVGKINHTTGSRVERAIRNALKITRDRRGRNEETIYYLGNDSCANGNSLMTLYMRLKNEAENTKTAEESGESIEEMIRRIVREEIRAALP